MIENELENRKKFRKAIVRNNIAYIYRVQKHKRIEYCLHMLETDLKRISEDKNYDYLLGTIPWLYDIKSFSQEKKKESYLQIQRIRYSIKSYLIEHKQSKENRYHHKTLSKLLGKLELLSLTISNPKESVRQEELEVLNYFIFKIKNIDLVKKIINNNPQFINCLDKEAFDLLLSIMDSYVLSLKEHVKTSPLKHFDNLLYFDRVLSLFIDHEKNHFTMKELKCIYDFFDKASKENIYKERAKDRYAYFIEKYKSLFQEFMLQKRQNKPITYNKKMLEEELFYQYDIHPKFSIGTRQEAKSIYFNRLLNPLKPGERLIYTVDSEGAEELDDGFSLEANNDIYELGIHVSNPTDDISEQSKILEEVLKRVYSYYLYENTIFLYPEILGKDLFSLKENTTKRVLSLYAQIDRVQKKIVKQELKVENVVVAKNDTYESCNQVLSSSENSSYKEVLQRIQEILPILEGFYKIDSMYSLVARQEPNITHTNITGKTSSEKMIESFMIFFNSCVARLANDCQIPFLYRNHALDPLYKKDCEYYLERFKKEQGMGYYTEELNILKFRYPNSYYDTESIGHAGLGVDHYCHISSAARRAGDNLNLLMLNKYYFQQAGSKEEKKDLKKLKRYAEYFNEQEKNMKGFSGEYCTLVRRK